MGIGRKITESFRKMAGPSETDRPAMEIYVSSEAVAIWNEEVGRWTVEDMAAQARMVQERVSELARRVESLHDQPPALPLVRELLINARELATLRSSREQRVAGDDRVAAGPAPLVEPLQRLAQCSDGREWGLFRANREGHCGPLPACDRHERYDHVGYSIRIAGPARSRRGGSK